MGSGGEEVGTAEQQAADDDNASPPSMRVGARLLSPSVTLSYAAARLATAPLPARPHVRPADIGPQGRVFAKKEKAPPRRLMPGCGALTPQDLHEEVDAAVWSAPELFRACRSENGLALHSTDLQPRQGVRSTGPLPSRPVPPTAAG